MNFSRSLFKENKLIKNNSVIKLEEIFLEFNDLLIFLKEYGKSYKAIDNVVSKLLFLITNKTKSNRKYLIPYFQFTNKKLLDIFVVSFKDKDKNLKFNKTNYKIVIILLDYIYDLLTNEKIIESKKFKFFEFDFIIENNSYLSNNISYSAFGKKSIISKKNYNNDFWKNNFFSALKIIKRFFPDILVVLNQNLDIFVPVTSNDKNNSLSSSRADIDNLIIVSKVPEKEMSEAIIHEVSHVILNKLNLIKPFVVNHDKVFYSPFRSDPRHALGLLHAAYSFLNVSIFLNELYFKETRLKIWSKYKLSDYLFNALFCVEVLIKNNSVLSKFGYQTCKDIKLRLMKIYESHQFEILDDHYNEKKQHFKDWLNENQSNQSFESTFKKIMSKIKIVKKFKEEKIVKFKISKTNFYSFSQNIFNINKPVFIRNEKLIDEKLLWTQLTKNNSKKIELIDADSYKGHKTKYNVSYNSLDDYRKKFQKNTSKSKFLVITNFNKFISAEIWLSDYLSKSFWLGSVNTWFFMNKKNLRVLCHNDSVNNLHHVVFGKKTFFLAPPSASLDKYVNQHFQEGFNSFNPFKEVEKAKKIGKFLVLNKNDSLYIPNGWWHSVYYNEDTIAISALDEPTHI